MNQTQVCLLAAGNGKRAGGPKAWLPHQGTPLLEKQIDFLLNHFEPSAIGVSIQEEWRQRCLKINPKIRWISADPQAQALSSVIAVLKSSSPSHWTFIYHVDMPVWQAKLFETLAACARWTKGAEAIVPAHKGERGHPALISPRLKQTIEGLNPETDRLDFILRSKEVETMDVPFACVRENLNYGHEYA